MPKRPHRARIAGMLIAVIAPTMLLVALLSWGIASPVGASPDDDYHMASIWCGGGVDDLCMEGLAEGQMHVPKVLITNSSCFAFHPEKSGICQVTPTNELVNTARGNFLGGYPPAFYAVMSLFSDHDIVLSVLMMRTFNAALFVTVATLLFCLLPHQRRGPLAWGIAMTLVPLGMFLIPSVNPSSWAVLSAATLWISLVGYFNATQRKKQAAFASIAVVATLAGAGARADSAVYAGLAVAVAVILTVERSRRYALRAILPAVLALTAVAFFVTAGQSAILSSETAAGESEGSVQLVFANLVLLPQLWAGALGTTGLGWLDTAMPGMVWVPTLAVFFSLVFWGLQHLSTRRAAALCLVFASLVVVPLYILVKDQVLVGAGVQPRYVYPLLIILAGLALWIKGGDLRLSRVQSAALAILLTIANSVALHTNLRRYVTGIDEPGVDLNVGVEWWWDTSVSPMAVWIAGSIAFGVAMTVLASYSLRESDTASTDVLRRRVAASERSDLVNLASNPTL